MPIAPVFLHFGWAFGGTEFFLICDYKGISSSEEGQKKSYYKNTPYWILGTEGWRAVLLVAYTRLYKSLRRSIGWFVGWLVHPSIRHAVRKHSKKLSKLHH